MPDYQSQEPFIDAEFEDIIKPGALVRVPDPRLFENVEPRCPCVLLLDTSSSMDGRPIAELNAGLQQFKTDLLDDPLSRKRVEIAVVAFGGNVRVASQFQTADELKLTPLVANGLTPMGEAIIKAIELITIRKAQIRSQGVGLYRPWIFLITDGEPTDNWTGAAAYVQKGEQSKRFVFFPVGVTGYNKEILSAISVREPVRLIDSTKFRELFKWLSTSLSSVSGSQPGDQIVLQNAPASTWAVID